MMLNMRGWTPLKGAIDDTHTHGEGRSSRLHPESLEEKHWPKETTFGMYVRTYVIITGLVTAVCLLHLSYCPSSIFHFLLPSFPPREQEVYTKAEDVHLTPGLLGLGVLFNCHA